MARIMTMEKVKYRDICSVLSRASNPVRLGLEP